MLFPFNTVPHVVLTPTQKVIVWLLPNCDFATAMNHNASIFFEIEVCQTGLNPYVENPYFREKPPTNSRPWKVAALDEFSCLGGSLKNRHKLGT